MEVMSWSTIDKSSWGEGPWENEPDKLQWPDQETRLPCLMLRHSRAGHWCGYVGLTEEHPFFGKGYNEVFGDIDAHGGLTFSGACEPMADPSRSICHIPGNGEPDHIWWFGFDCAHSGDLSPGISGEYKIFFGGEGSYKDQDYVASQCHQLAVQLLAVAVLPAMVDGGENND